MSLIRDYGLKDPGAAEDFVMSAFKRLDYVVALLPGAWAEMERRRTWPRIASVRVSLLEYASAAYALQENATFGRTCDGLLTYSPAKSVIMSPAPAQLLPDIAVAVSRDEAREAREVAARILRGPGPGDGEPADAACALIIAALTDLDYGRAEEISTGLALRCRAKEFRRSESAVLAPWAEAAAALARRDATVPVLHFRAIAEARRSYIDRELARWGKGQPTELSPVDFWDWATTALAGIAQSFGYDLHASEDMSWAAFADSLWTSGHD